MSWQRIDENTYIDDTLVTCAEYQLFIDEMHEQGKYYQPDHWTSYQFPEGQAREPILGVRHLDAVAFCEWLTSREGKEWKFRLPNQEEANAFPTKLISESSLGYWINEDHQFAWIGVIPENIHAYTFTTTLSKVSNFDRTLANAVKVALDEDYGSALSFVSTLVLDLILVFDRTRDLDRVPTRYHLFTLESALERAYALDRDLIRNRILDLNHDLDYSRALDNSRAFALAFVLNFADDHATDFARALALVSDRPSDLDRVISRALDLARSLIARTYELNLALDIYVDLFTLQERIAGRSPAFEGIRLVKERIR